MNSFSEVLGDAEREREIDRCSECAVASELRAKIAELREALIPFQCETCNGTHVFTFECPGCLSGIGDCTCDKQKPEPCPQCQSDNGCKEIYAKLERALSDKPSSSDLRAYLDLCLELQTGSAFGCIVDIGAKRAKIWPLKLDGKMAIEFHLPDYFCHA